MTVTTRHRLMLTVGAASPLLVAVVVLAFRPWVPVLDMVMTEFRVRDVGGSETPLVGLPGRIGLFPDQGSHPGPWSFYLIAPFHLVAGSSAWGMELGSVMINTAAIAALVWIGHRRGGVTGALLFAAVAAVAVRGYGLTVLTHPWNPYFPVLLWLVALVATWSVLVGDSWLAPLATGCSVIAAQTHVPYLLVAIGVNVVVLGALGWRWSHRRPDGTTVRIAAVTLATAALLWSPPFVEQVRGGDDGNIAALIDHFTAERDEPTIGWGAAAELVSQHFDVVSLGADLVTRDDSFVHRAGQAGAGTSVTGVLVVAAWLAAIGWAWQKRHRPLLAVHLVTATTTLIALVSISRIFGKVWFYLTLWMSATVLLVAGSILWTCWLVLRRRYDGGGPRPVAVAAAAVGVSMTVLSLVEVPSLQVPEPELAEDVAAIVPTVIAALDDHVGVATGKAGSYVVFWQESVVPGAQGYALMNELERNGYRVGVHPTWRVPATGHRVRTAGEYDAEIHLVSGEWIEEWRDRPDHVLVVEYDDRDDSERDRFALLEERVRQRLTEIGRADLIAEYERNIFGTSLRPELPDDIVDDLGEMLLLGETIAVFVAPPGSTL